MMALENKPRYLRIFFALLLGFGGAGAWVWYTDKVFDNHVPFLDFPFQALYPLSIGAAAVITSLLFAQSFKPLALQIPAAKYWLRAAGFAVLFTVAPFVLNLLLHLTGLASPPSIYLQLLVVGFPIFFGLAIGEELMWRGFLYTELSRFMDFTSTCVTTGILWAFWHYPVIIHTHLLYADRPLYFAVPMFTALAVFFSFIYGYLRRVSGSVWPCILLHGLSNFILCVFIEPLEKPEYKWSPLFINDIGILYVTMVMIAGLYFYISVKQQKKI